MFQTSRKPYLNKYARERESMYRDGNVSVGVRGMLQTREVRQEKDERERNKEISLINRCDRYEI